MPETYTREGSFSLKKETTANVAVTPDVFIPITEESISNSYGYQASMPVQGNRAMNLRAIADKIAAPNGSISLNIEPDTLGYFLEGLGDLISGVYFKTSDADNGDIAEGDTISNGSTGTGTVEAILGEENVIIASGVSGDWATNDTVSNGGTHSSILQTFDASVYGHVVQLPLDISNTFTCQVNYVDRAVRYMGCRFHGIDALSQSDNIMTAGVKLMAQSVLSQARVTAAVTSGAGAKSIPIDQTQGFVASDTIKVYRPGTGFLDFASASVKTHTIGTVDAANGELDITNLQTSLQAGDLIVLAPQTPTYSIDEEFPWIGGAQMSIGADVDNLSSFDCQEFSMVFNHELEERHAAQGTGIANRMPSDILQKGFTGSGSFKLHNENEDFYRHYRLNTDQAIRLALTGTQIGSTGIYHQFACTYAQIQFDPYDLNLTSDDILEEEVPFTSFYNTTEGWSVQLLLVNDTASY